jgi:hypothetical protein
MKAKRIQIRQWLLFVVLVTIALYLHSRYPIESVVPPDDEQTLDMSDASSDASSAATSSLATPSLAAPPIAAQSDASSSTLATAPAAPVRALRGAPTPRTSVRPAPPNVTRT